MGQRVLADSPRRADSKRVASATARPACLAVFDTELGWFGLLGQEQAQIIQRIFLGHPSAEQVRRAAASALAAQGNEEPPQESDWHASLRRDIQDFARGRPTDFRAVKIQLEKTTPFRKRVLECTRRIAYGQTLTYGQLAARAGNPGAARAVGTVMASNPLPLVIPCHRVVASGGMGGFSAPHGLELKRRLLELEATAR